MKSIASCFGVGLLVSANLLGCATSTELDSQKTLGQILQEGGKKLSATEVRKLLVGNTFVRNGRNGQVYVDVNPDGRISGYASSRLGSTGIAGTWKILEDGRMCAKYAFTDANIRGVDNCAFQFSANGKYYLSDSDIDPQARAREWHLKQ
jgi:hypothetical protein